MIEYHKTLNPKLWLDNKLIPEVKTKLIEIYQTFINKLKENEIPIDVIDVLILGSNAAYNYTDNSDIDLHIVTDFEDLGLNSTLTQLFYNNEKSKFNDDYDITIKGLPVELYIEDINAGTKSNGIYSLLQDKWIKFPEYNPPKEIDYSFLLNTYQNKVNKALEGTPEQIKNIINEIKMLRKLSLMNNGEYSKGNLVFKELRNNGSIDNLYNKLHELTSKELSLEKMNNLKENSLLEVNLHTALDNIATKITSMISNNNVRHPTHSINVKPDYKKGVVYIKFKDTNVEYEIKPKEIEKFQINKGRPISIKLNYPKATYNAKDYSFYVGSKRIGTAYVNDTRNEYNNNYSDSLDDAEKRYHDKIITTKNLYAKIGKDADNSNRIP